jgi:hydrogenase/urease accessory protein HupE
MKRHPAALVALFLAWLLGASGAALAHEVRPAFLEITENGDQTIDVLFKQPSMASLTVRLEPEITGGLLQGSKPRLDAGTGFQSRQWERLRVGPQGLADREVTIEGLDRSITDALVIIRYADGNVRQEILKSGRQGITLDARGDALPVRTYLMLGIEHILTGYDHLLFVLALMLLVAGFVPLVQTITSFTVAHSITLALSALGVVHFDAPKIEMLVALSIAFVALELAYKKLGRWSLAQQWPWLIAFAFGLLHGSAFAGALSQIGLPTRNIPLALFLFNVGVEIGQLIFVAVILAFITLLRRIPASALPLSPRAIELAPAYTIGPVAVFWCFERFHAAVF